MKVRTLRRHDNGYGDSYAKHPGKVYDHPAPAQLVKDGLVEIVRENKRRPKRKPKGQAQTRRPAGGGEPAKSEDGA